MRIFISHSQKDENFATKLQKQLEQESKINHIFMFEKKQRYGIQIDQNIIKEILSADYVIALITKNAKESASVNQELGYAQAKSIPVIPLIEKNAKKGFLVYGSAYIEFTLSNFDNACKKIQCYIIEHGPRIKDEETFTQQELLVQKSAHFRYWMQYENYHLIESLLVRFQLNEEYYINKIFTDNPIKALEGLSEFKSFLKNNPKQFKKHILESNLMSCRKFSSEFGMYGKSFEHLNRYPHSDLLPIENDALIKIKDMIVSENEDEHQFNFEHLAKYLLEDEFPQKASTFQEILKNTINKSSRDHLQRNFDFMVKDLTNFCIMVITLQEEFEKIRKKYGELGIKSTEP